MSVLQINVEGIRDVESLTVEECNLIVGLTDGRSIVSLNHFSDPFPVLPNPERRPSQRGNAGKEGEVAVLQQFVQGGIERKNIFRAKLVETVNGHYELWDGLIRVGNKLIVVQTKTRQDLTAGDQKNSWLGVSSNLARKQIRKAYNLLDPYLNEGKKMVLKNYEGGQEKINLADYELRHLIVLAVNRFVPAHPGKFFNDAHPSAPYPGTVITLKELRDIMWLLGAEGSMKYLTEEAPFTTHNFGFELVRYAHKINFGGSKTLVIE